MTIDVPINGHLCEKGIYFTTTLREQVALVTR